jgi:hypothetical protein
MINSIKSLGRRVPGLRWAYLTFVERIEKKRLAGRLPADVFTDIYKENRWRSNQSLSGPGSTIEQTQAVIEVLPLILKKYNVKTMLDIPCGDFNWLKNADLRSVEYTGADIVDEIVEKNKREFGADGRRFLKLNLLEDELPQSDLVFCRDCLVHFSFNDISKALANVCKSGSTYLLTTSFIEHTNDQDILTGQWRPLNLLAAPFSLPRPDRIIDEKCTEGGGRYSDKSLCLWHIESIAPVLSQCRG